MFGRIRRCRRTVSRNTTASRRNAKMPRVLPSSVVFNQIDYQGEHMDLAVPIEAGVVLNEFGDVCLYNDEAYVRGSGPTLEEAKEDFCGSFLLCYKLLSEYGPGNEAWIPIMRHAGCLYGDGEKA